MVLPSLKKNRSRTTYHPDIKAAVQLDILPPEIKSLIPKSTRSTFKKQNLSDIFGIEYSHYIPDAIELTKKLIECKSLLKLYRAFNRIKNTIIFIYSHIKNIKTNLKRFKEKIVTTIERVKDSLGLERACHWFFNISVKTFYSWLSQVRHTCPTSVLNRCRHTWPHQLTVKEQNIMKKCLNDPFFKGWAVYQIAIYALIHNILPAFIGTWYKYIKEFGYIINRIRKKKPKQGIRASRSNELWHMDVTVYKTNNVEKVSIYILMDNFSRFILAWKLSRVLSGSIFTSMLREAFFKYLDPVPHAAGNTTILFCDGGPENNNSYVDGFVNQNTIPIKKLIAQKDIHFSNSMIEAFNKKLKYQHLFPSAITDYHSLEKHLEKSIDDYNTLRPHHAHAKKYLIPSQVYFGESIDIKNIKKQLEEARKRRILENRNAKCPGCST
jgi:putative transposase